MDDRLNKHRAAALIALMAGAGLSLGVSPSVAATWATQSGGVSLELFRKSVEAGDIVLSRVDRGETEQVVIADWSNGFNQQFSNKPPV